MRVKPEEFPFIQWNESGAGLQWTSKFEVTSSKILSRWQEPTIEMEARTFCRKHYKWTGILVFTCQSSSEAFPPEIETFMVTPCFTAIITYQTGCKHHISHIINIRNSIFCHWRKITLKSSNAQLQTYHIIYIYITKFKRPSIYHMFNK